VEAVEYERLAHFEDSYWWYRAQREWVLDCLRRINLRPGSRVLDAGCGTGRTIEQVIRRFSVTGFGLDCSPHAAQFWRNGACVRRCLGSVNELPYADGSFDVVVSVDVLQARQVRPATAIAELARVLRPGGCLVLLVPAFQWMLSRHDEAVHCVRRLDRRRLRCLVADTGLNVERLAYLFGVFFPAIAAVRLLTKLRSNRNGHAVRSDLSDLPGWLNRSLLGMARAERVLLHGRGAPFGSTLLMVARKG